MSAQTDLFKTIIRSLSQERFSEAVALFERVYLGNTVVAVDGHDDGGCDFKRFKNGKELKECVQVTVNKTNLKKKLFEDLVKVKRLITQFGYSPSLDFYCSEVLADDKINEYREFAKSEHGIELQIYDANRLSGLDCPKLQEYLYELIKLGPSSFPDVDLSQYLSMRLAWTRKHHPSFKLMEIDDSLFPEGIEKYYNITALNDADDPKTVPEIVADSWSREKNHLMIEGEGGIGKTVTLLSLPDMFVPHKVPALYIQLHELKGISENETLQDYILSRIFFNDEFLFKQFDIRTRLPWNEGPQVLLLLDGFNEIAPERRFSIGEDINRWADRPGVQIITSSRFDIHTYVPLGEGYSKVLLQALSQENIKEFLGKSGIPFPSLESQWKVINYPLMLTLYAQTEKVMALIDKDDDLQDFKPNNSAGAIIWNYLQREIWRFRKNKANVVKCVLSAEFVAPYIAWKMQKESRFYLDSDSFEIYLDQACDLFSKLDSRQLRKHISSVLPRRKKYDPDNDELQAFIEKELRLFIKNGETYTLMHQQFRDALAALHLINISYASSEFPDEWKVPVDYYVMQFVADLASKEEADKLWEKNLTLKPSVDTATINMFELQSRIRNYIFSDLSFRGMDLRTISLFPYRDLRDTTIHLPHDPSLNDGLLLSNNTFFPNGHSGDVSVVVLTPDGQRCVSGSLDGTLRIWDINSGQCLKTIKVKTGFKIALAIPHDGKRIVYGTWSSNTLYIFDLDSGECLNVLDGHTDRIMSFAITSDDCKCVSASLDSTLRIWDMGTGECLKVLKEHNKGVISVAITPDGKSCVSGSIDKTLRIWDMDSGECLKTLSEHKSSIDLIAITPNGKRCISCDSFNPPYIWDMEAKKCLMKLKGYSFGINSLTISSDGKYCYVGASDGVFRVWDIETGQRLSTIRGINGSVCTPAITPDGKSCASGSSDNGLKIWDLKSGESKTLKGHTGEIMSVAVTPDGKRCISGSRDNTLRIWDMDSGRCLKILEGNRDSFSAFAITSDGRIGVCDSVDNNLHVWDLKLKQCVKSLEAHDRPIKDIAITPNGRRSISCDSDHKLRVWDMESGDCIRTIKVDEGAVFAITPDGTRCVCSGHINVLQILDCETGTLIDSLSPFEFVSPQKINALYIASDGEKCVSGSENGTVRLWELKNGVLRNEFNRYVSTPLSPHAVTLDDEKCICGYKDHKLIIWDLKSGKCLKTLEGYSGNINTLVIAPGGKKCIGGSTDGKLRIWDLTNGECMKTLEGYDGFTRAVAITPNGERCIAGTIGRTITEWNLETNQVSKITILPISLMGVNLSLSVIDSPEFREVLRQNGAAV